jgi:hypothetical protein
MSELEPPQKTNQQVGTFSDCSHALLSFQICTTWLNSLMGGPMCIHGYASEYPKYLSNFSNHMNSSQFIFRLYKI